MLGCNGQVYPCQNNYIYIVLGENHAFIFIQQENNPNHIIIQCFSTACAISAYVY